MVSRIDVTMSYPHKEANLSYKETKKSEDRGFQSILDESIKELKKKGVKDCGNRENI